MNVEDYSPLIQKRPDLTEPIRDATILLEQTMGFSAAARATAGWTLSHDPKGRELVRLLVSDWIGSVGYQFAPEELRDATHMRFRLNRLWGDLLQVSSHVLFDGRIEDSNHLGTD